MQFNEQTKSDEPEDMINARHAILASLPIPFDIPEDSLKPILIPAPFTLHEFLGNAPGVSLYIGRDILPPLNTAYTQVLRTS